MRKFAFGRRPTGNCLHTHSVLVYITHISFTTPFVFGIDHATNPQ